MVPERLARSRAPDTEPAMMRKLLAILVLVPLAVVIVMFAVSNREIVKVSLDPFNSVQPAFAMQMPLFMLIFALVLLGVLIGGVAAWLGQHRWRRAARRYEAELRMLRNAVQAQEQRASGAANLPAVPRTDSPLVIRAPAA
jgi:uncharacterized integral membrane protein